MRVQCPGLNVSASWHLKPISVGPIEVHYDVKIVSKLHFFPREEHHSAKFPRSRRLSHRIRKIMAMTLYFREKNYK